MTKQLADITMAPGEAIDSYYGQMEDIIFRLPANYGFTDRHIRNIFVRGLVPQRLKAFVKLDLPANWLVLYKGQSSGKQPILRINWIFLLSLHFPIEL